MELFPPLAYESWRPTKDTLHRFAQIVGKVRLAASPRRNHWWNVPSHLTGRGLTTRPMGLTDQGDYFCIDFDFVDHRLVVTTGRGGEISFVLPGLSVADFYQQLHSALAELGVSARVALPRPYDLPDAARPFADDHEHRAYEPAQVTRYWQILSQVNLVLEEYAAQWSGKTSPVHHFWHTFDIAVTRFSERVIEQPTSVDPVTREAYSREAISAGFWFGSPDFPKPAFYSYTAPEPSGLAEQPLEPASAHWVPSRGSHLAVLDYDIARTSSSPRDTVRAFLDSAYHAGARLAGWDTARDTCPGGITDPVVTPVSRSASGALHEVRESPTA
ncbi:DUF5996 family protein [Streptomyces sp. NBC_01728]|uniref:DUF5996 family protein n=1 Tax=unclassified Streptomyces TaxID=2593676 RepID=UPI0022514EF9|nr:MULTISPECIES: DUF5996 family protein [unclassified Streptomyces]MCX4461718.1 DUF5996 family protein [Streptomyces sp. NBC_01719]MCX4490627.1 DUF5996 family protein [Streptomyces sp. NBC_01728]